MYFIFDDDINTFNISNPVSNGGYKKLEKVIKILLKKYKIKKFTIKKKV